MNRVRIIKLECPSSKRILSPKLHRIDSKRLEDRREEIFSSFGNNCRLSSFRWCEKYLQTSPSFKLQIQLHLNVFKISQAVAFTVANLYINLEMPFTRNKSENWAKLNELKDILRSFKIWIVSGNSQACARLRLFGIVRITSKPLS